MNKIKAVLKFLFYLIYIVSTVLIFLIDSYFGLLLLFFFIFIKLLKK